MTPADLERLEALVAAMTPGKWCPRPVMDPSTDDPSAIETIDGQAVLYAAECLDGSCEVALSIHDHRGIIALRNAAPSLLADHRQLTAELAAAEQERDAARATARRLNRRAQAAEARVVELERREDQTAAARRYAVESRRQAQRYQMERDTARQDVAAARREREELRGELAGARAEGERPRAELEPAYPPGGWSVVPCRHLGEPAIAVQDTHPNADGFTYVRPDEARKLARSLWNAAKAYEPVASPPTAGEHTVLPAPGESACREAGVSGSRSAGPGGQDSPGAGALSAANASADLRALSPAELDVYLADARRRVEEGCRAVREAARATAGEPDTEAALDHATRRLAQARRTRQCPRCRHEHLVGPTGRLCCGGDDGTCRCEPAEGGS